MPPARSIGAHAIRKPRGKAGVRTATARPKVFRLKALHEDMTLPDAAVILAGNTVGKLDACWQSVVDENSPERVHKLRVALRQTRVVLQIFRKLDGSGLVDDRRQVLAEIAQKAGRQRDLDVVIGDIVKPLQTADNAADITALIEVLQADRDRVRADFAEYIDGSEGISVRAQLAALPEQLGAIVGGHDAKGHIGKFAQRALKRRWRKLERQMENFATLDAEGLHEMRKSLKKLRYTFGHFAAFWAKRDGAVFVAQTQQLQTTFGYFNDVESAKRLTQGARVSAPALGFTIGFVLGIHCERARHSRRKILKLWQKLAATEIGRELTAR